VYLILERSQFQRAKTEETLTSELQQLRDQVNLKRTSMNEHVSHLDMLREEVMDEQVHRDLNGHFIRFADQHDD